MFFAWLIGLAITLVTLKFTGSLLKYWMEDDLLMEEFTIQVLIVILVILAFIPMVNVFTAMAGMVASLIKGILLLLGYLDEKQSLSKITGFFTNTKEGKKDDIKNR